MNDVLFLRISEKLKDALMEEADLAGLTHTELARSMIEKCISERRLARRIAPRDGKKCAEATK
jgi:antitoxin component of RelBE/YafQ-DinJ toxin-antitoxin module